ncbi:Kinesin-like protein kif3a [Boothiomyces sp. JEL0866]|nr:Kinesin-like protein kif3a [Boothiomyces sp. JEL0866]
MSEKESVKVILRCRPFSEKEKQAGHSNIVQMDTKSGTVTIVDPRSDRGPGDPPKTFTFDHVFDHTCTQTEVYSMTARDIVDCVLQGYNGTVFAYGQTGTGKTFSMEGIRDVPELRGIIPMAFDHIFGYIKHAGAKTQFLVRASYLEIYNEEIRDLLNLKSKKLDIKERADTGVYVRDLSTFVIQNVEEMDQLMTVGNKNRSVGFTEMNATSSRSHSIFTITVEASETDENGEQRLRAGKLHLVDLAGSERQTKTGATGDRLKEATKINLSLSALGNVISALVDGKSSHIPYRDSKLTRLLQDSLGGNAKTLMVATMSPASYNYDETISTLRYANRAKNIKNKPKVNEDPKDAMLREFQEEIKRLKNLLENTDGGEETVIEEVEEVEEIEEIEENENEPNKSQKQRKDKSKKIKKPKEGKLSIKNEPGPAGIPESELAKMQELVEKEKQAILASKDMEESERNKLVEEAELRMKELEKERAARAEVAAKLAQLEQKLLVGGVNILDQHQEQQITLAKKAQELEEGVRKQRELEMNLNEKEELNLQIEEEFSNLQEEATSKTKKLKKLWTMLMEQKSELKDLKEEHQREKENLLETIRELTSEIKLRQAIIQGFIPPAEQEIINECAEYDDTAEKWRIAHVAHAGNNIKGTYCIIKGKRSLISGQLQFEHQGLHRVLEPEEVWDPMCIFPDPFLSYDVPGLKKNGKKTFTVKMLKNKKIKETAPAPQARAVMEEFGFQQMTAVQSAVLSQLPVRNDLLVRAKTGTGKTLAFMVAALETALSNNAFGKNNIPILVLTPTRELAMQIAVETEKLVRHHRLHVQVAVGGTGRMQSLNRILNQRTDILIATPGRLNDILGAEKGLQRKLLDLNVLIFDEADQLLDMGFQREIDRILSNLPPPNQRHTFMFSATLSSEIRAIAKSSLNDGYKDIDTVPANEVDTHMKIRQSYIVAPHKDHYYLIQEMVQKHKESTPGSKIIVFFPTTKLVSFAKSILEKAVSMDIMEIHSRLTQQQRVRVSDKFRKSRSSILFTSDVSARGVDYPGVTLVLQVGLPSSRDQYIHRIGRTGRAGKEGESILLLSPYEENYLKSVSDLPIRKELRYSLNRNGRDSATIEKLSMAIQNTDQVEKFEIFTSMLGYQISKLEISRIRKDTCIEGISHFCQGYLDMPLPAIPQKLVDNLGLRNVPGVVVQGNRRLSLNEGRYPPNQQKGNFSNSVPKNASKILESLESGYGKKFYQSKTIDENSKENSFKRHSQSRSSSPRRKFN